MWPCRKGKDGVVCSGDSEGMGGSWRERCGGPLIHQLVPTNARMGLDLAQVCRVAEGAAGHQAVSDGNECLVFAFPQLPWTVSIDDMFDNVGREGKGREGKGREGKGREDTELPLQADWGFLYRSRCADAGH